MRVINLLPWREELYRKRLRNFVMSLSGVGTAGVVWAFIAHQATMHDRMVYSSRVAHLQATLAQLEQEHDLLQQSLLQAAENTMQARARIDLQQQQRQWLQVISEWQLLAQSAQISGITWLGSELSLSAVSAVADPLRQLMYASPQWQLEEIELNAQARYRFVVSRTMQTAEGI